MHDGISGIAGHIEYLQSRPILLRSFADLAVNPDVAAALPDEAVDLAKAEAGSSARWLCGEERIERLADQLRRHADAGIRYCDHDVLAGLYPIRISAIGFIQKRIAGL